MPKNKIPLTDLVRHIYEVAIRTPAPLGWVRCVQVIFHSKCIRLVEVRSSQFAMAGE